MYRLDVDERYPHLPAVLRPMTAEQALDEVAKTWAGEIVVMYGVCSEPDSPMVGRGSGWGWPAKSRRGALADSSAVIPPATTREKGENHWAQI